MLMAQYDIKYACGHTATKQLYGKDADRQRYIAWAGLNASCPACTAANAATALADLEAEYGLPPLDGSLKQIDWSRQIRADKIREFVVLMDKQRAAVREDKLELFDVQNAVVITAMCGVTAAKWWIDHRDDGAFSVARQLFAQAKG
jgi:hypothetical protein